MLVISFFALAVLWPQPRLEERDSWRALPGGRVIASAPVAGGLRRDRRRSLLVRDDRRPATSARGTALDNWAPTFILITFWVGLVFASILFGDVFRAFSPWRALGRLLPSLNRPVSRSSWGAGRRRSGCSSSPGSSSSSGWGDHPATLVTAALGYTVVTLAAQSSTASRRGRAAARRFAVYYNLFSRMSIFETRDGVVGVRPPLGGLPTLDRGARHGRARDRDDRHGHVRRAQPGPAVAGPVGRHRRRARRRDRRADRVEDRVDDRAASRAWGSSPASTGSGSRARARSAAGPDRAAARATGFIHTLVPIAAVYVAAHYLTFLIFEGQAIIYLASRPVRPGLGPVRHRRLGDRLLDLPARRTPGTSQVAFVVVGHVAALTLAHDRALTLYGDAQARRALAVLDARRDGRLHLARALAAGAGRQVGQITRCGWPLRSPITVRPRL